MGRVTTYFLSDEKLAARQETRKNRKPPIPKSIKRWDWNRITKSRYKQMKKDGLTESDMINDIPWLTKKILEESKKNW